MSAALCQHCGKIVFVGWLAPGKAHIVMYPMDAFFGLQIAQWFNRVKVQDQALNEFFEIRSGLSVIFSVCIKPFMIIILAKLTKKPENLIEFGHNTFPQVSLTARTDNHFLL